LNSIGRPDFFHDKKYEVNSETKDVGFSGTRYFSLDEKPKVKVESRVEVGEGSAGQNFSLDLKCEIKLEPHDEFGEISGEKTCFMRTLNTTNNDVKPGPSVCDSHGSSAADRYSHIGESSFKRKFLQNITGNIATNLEHSLLVGTSLAQDKELDELFKMRLLAKQSSKHYQNMMEFRQKLPSFGMRNQILELVEQNQVVVISGETGKIFIVSEKFN
jgi:HrpA-like RNA helicase